MKFKNVDVDLLGVPEHNQNRPWSHLHAWALNNEPSDAMLNKAGYWRQIVFVRDDLSGMFHKKLKEISVISTHRSKSITLPVFMISLNDGTVMIMRCNFHNWMVTVISDRPVFLNTACFKSDEKIDPIYCEGFDPSWVLGPYADSKRRFTFKVYNDDQLFHFLQGIAEPDPLILSLASALERTSNRLRKALSSVPVGDADETLEEARHLLNDLK